MLVAFAVTAGTPAQRSVGNVSKVPPPAIELTTPANAEAKRRSGS